MNYQQLQNLQQQYIKIQQSETERENLLCKLVGNKNLVSLTFEDGDYDQQMRDSKFIKFLDKYSQNKIKIITTFGEMGQGKSFIQNFIIQQFQNNTECIEIFKIGNGNDSQTKGIKFYFPQNLQEPQQQKEEIIVLFDCEGFDLSIANSNIHMQNLIKLVCLIVRLSTCVLYVNSNIRIPRGFDNILSHLKEDNQNEQIPHNNFIQIQNMWNGQIQQTYQNENKFIKKVFKLRSLNFENELIIADRNYISFIDEIKALCSYLRESYYISSSDSCQAFQKEQTCNNFKEMLICCFQIIQKQMNCTTKLFLRLIDKQSLLKQEYKKQIEEIRNQVKQNYVNKVQSLQESEGYRFKSNILFYLFNLAFQTYESKKVQKKFLEANQKWKNQFKAALKQILLESQNNNERQLSEDEQNQIIEQYESLKPEEMRVYERYLSCSIEKQLNFNLGKFILNLVFLNIITSLSYRYVLFLAVPQFLPFIIGLQLISNLIQGPRIKSLKSKLTDFFFEPIQQRIIMANQQNNLYLLQQMLQDQIPKLKESFLFNIETQENKNAISFLLLMNCISNSLDIKQLQQKNETNNQIFECLMNQKLKQKINDFSFLKNLHSSKKITINDNDFSFYAHLQDLDFKDKYLSTTYRSLFTNLDCQHDIFYKLMFVLRNRNEDLYLFFVINIFFQDYIESDNFANLIIENKLIEKTMLIQHQILSIQIF